MRPDLTPGSVTISCDRAGACGSTGVFEAIQQRQRGPSLWKAFGVITTACCVLVWGGLKLRENRDKSAAELRHEKNSAEDAEQQARDHAALHPDRVKLPGMSVPLAEPEITGDYDHGSAVSTTFARGAMVRVGISWDAGEMPDAIRRDRLVMDSAETMSEARPFVLAHNERKTFGVNTVEQYTLVAGPETAIIGYSRCDDRTIRIVVRSGESTVGLFERVMLGFRCTPGR